MAYLERDAIDAGGAVGDESDVVLAAGDEWLIGGKPPAAAWSVLEQESGAGEVVEAPHAFDDAGDFGAGFGGRGFRPGTGSRCSGRGSRIDDGGLRGHREWFAGGHWS